LHGLPRARPPRARNSNVKYAREDRTGIGHAASPRHFHHRPRPVYGLTRLDASPSRASDTQWLGPLLRPLDAPTLAYRCGGSTGFGSGGLCRCPHLFPVEPAARARPGTRCRMRAGSAYGERASRKPCIVGTRRAPINAPLAGPRGFSWRVRPLSSGHVPAPGRLMYRAAKSAQKGAATYAKQLSKLPVPS
jgi:hypothetical protein